MRRLVLPLAVCLTTAACSGAVISESESFSPSPSPSPSRSQSPIPLPQRLAQQVQVPQDAPIAFGSDVGLPRFPVTELVPPGATADWTWSFGAPDGRLQQIAVIWSRGNEHLGQEHGFELWQRLAEGGGWAIVYAFTDPAEAGVLGIRAHTADLTSDEIPDVLTFESTGGSGSCGTWRVIASGDFGASEILRRKTCDTDISPEGGVLKIRAAVYAPGNAHCCPSAFRTTTLRWDGAAWEIVDRVVAPSP
ncbi:MAG: hypothetical protein AB1551_04535 [Actinomycetota bacterium]